MMSFGQLSPGQQNRFHGTVLTLLIMWRAYTLKPPKTHNYAALNTLLGAPVKHITYPYPPIPIPQTLPYPI